MQRQVLAIQNLRDGACDPSWNKTPSFKTITYNNYKIIRHSSQPFKLKILVELSTRKYTKSQLGKRYITAPRTTNVWIRKHERKDLINNRVKVETKDGTTRPKGLQKEIEQLKELVLKRNLDAIVEECYLEFAAEN